MYGVPRATADVDVTVRLQGTPSQLLASLAKHGFQIHIAPAEIARFITDTRVIPAVHMWPVTFRLISCWLALGLKN